MRASSSFLAAVKNRKGGRTFMRGIGSRNGYVWDEAVVPRLHGERRVPAEAVIRGASGILLPNEYATLGPNGQIRAGKIERPALLPDDVAIDIPYCGVCHSDINMVRGKWGEQQYPMAPEHEFVGRVSAFGATVTRLAPGDHVGVGCLIDSCGECETSEAVLEQYCATSATMTYTSPDPRGSDQTLGGYSALIVVRDRFVGRISTGADLATTAPLLCSGVSTFSPVQHWQLGSGQRFAVVGLSGLGHITDAFLRVETRRSASAS